MYRAECSRVLLFLVGWPAVLFCLPCRAQYAGEQPGTTLVVSTDEASRLHEGRILRIGREVLRRLGTLRYQEASNQLQGEETAKQFDLAREFFEQGRKNYDSLELDQAADMLEQAGEELLSRLERPLDRDLLTNALIHLGATYQLQGREDEARQTFRRLLTFNAQASLDPTVFPPAIARLFSQAVSEVRSAGSGSWRVQVVPEGAYVWIDGVRRGVSPIRITGLAAGDHILQVFCPGFQTFGLRREVQSGKEDEIAEQLKPVPGVKRFEQLVGQLRSDAVQADYPETADELMRLLRSERLVFLILSAQEEALSLQAFYYDRIFKNCLKNLTRSFRLQDADLERRLDGFFTMLVLQDAVLQDAEEDPIPAVEVPANDTKENVPEPEPSRGLLSRWWFWTVAGVVVAGGVSLLLVLTLGGQEKPTRGQVVFSF